MGYIRINLLLLLLLSYGLIENLGDESGFRTIGLLENTPLLLRSPTGQVSFYNFHAAGASSRPHPSCQNSISTEATCSSLSDVVCRSWNRCARSLPYSSCMFAHKCSLCRTSHRLSDCHNKARARDRKHSRSLVVSRDGTTKKR